MRGPLDLTAHAMCLSRAMQERPLRSRPGKAERNEEPEALAFVALAESGPTRVTRGRPVR